MPVEKKEVCEKCKGVGYVKEQNGQVHTCFECLSKGRLDVHSDKLPESRIKI